MFCRLITNMTRSGQAARIPYVWHDCIGCACPLWGRLNQDFIVRSAASTNASPHADIIHGAGSWGRARPAPLTFRWRLPPNTEIARARLAPAASRVHLAAMESGEPARAVQVGAAADGTLTYLVALPPEALPPVRPRDLAAAWDAARNAAITARWGTTRLFRFRRAD